MIWMISFLATAIQVPQIELDPTFLSFEVNNNFDGQYMVVTRVCYSHQAFINDMFTNLLLNLSVKSQRIYLETVDLTCQSIIHLTIILIFNSSETLN